MAIRCLSVLIFLTFILAPDSRRIQVVDGGDRSSPLHSLSTELSSTSLKNNKLMKGVRDIARPPPVYRCTIIMGVCGLTITEEKCVSMCVANYGDKHPWSICFQPAETKYIYCFCEFDCYKK
ncbi:uncharacterized protein LOC105164109 [Sesamum indicum]|uniref:Uncharacterized protein LOC105164109 n=1 Tax=Sesamum indicum TaxID=4182 RepID=A0A6I9T978_SESIN|nr:uncharacterized protein LOC105164109 [Sesamum indicum]